MNEFFKILLLVLIWQIAANWLTFKENPFGSLIILITTIYNTSPMPIHFVFFYIVVVIYFGFLYIIYIYHSSIIVLYIGLYIFGVYILSLVSLRKFLHEDS